MTPVGIRAQAPILRRMLFSYRIDNRMEEQVMQSLRERRIQAAVVTGGSPVAFSEILMTGEPPATTNKRFPDRLSAIVWVVTSVNLSNGRTVHPGAADEMPAGGRP